MPVLRGIPWITPSGHEVMLRIDIHPPEKGTAMAEPQDVPDDQAVFDASRDLLEGFVTLTLAKRELEAQLKAKKEEIAETEEHVLDVFAKLGVAALNIAGHTLSPRITLWAGAVNGDYPSACAALKEAGLQDFVQERFNTNSLSSYVRELEASPDGTPQLPLALVGYISVTEKHSVGVVKSARHSKR